MIAFTILAVGVLGVAASLLTALNFSRQSRAMTNATYLAEQQMEAFRAMPEADLLALLADAGYPNDSTNPIDPDPGDDDEMEFNRRWTIQPDTPEAGVFTLVVTVDWVDKHGNTRTSELRSMKANL